MSTNRAWTALVQAVQEKGSNCDGRYDEFSPPEDENGHTPLPSAAKARSMCWGCPLLGLECRRYSESVPRYVGVLDGKVRDDWGDQPMIEDIGGVSEDDNN